MKSGDPLLDWVEGEMIFVKEPGRAPAIVEVRAWLSGSFYAFRSALMYSVHKYASRPDWSVLDAIEC